VLRGDEPWLIIRVSLGSKKTMQGSAGPARRFEGYPCAGEGREGGNQPARARSRLNRKGDALHPHRRGGEGVECRSDDGGLPSLPPPASLSPGGRDEPLYRCNISESRLGGARCSRRRSHG
jgi:hypothetical protein